MSSEVRAAELALDGPGSSRPQLEIATDESSAAGVLLDGGTEYTFDRATGFYRDDLGAFLLPAYRAAAVAS